MYPIDAIKVRNIYILDHNLGSCDIDRDTDTHANHQSHPERGLQWYDPGRLQNSYGRGISQFMERHVQCSCWSWYVHLRGRGDKY